MVPFLVLTLAVAPIEQAQLMEKQGALDPAIELLERAVEGEPAWAMARVELGRLLLKRGRPEAALEHLDLARTLASENPRAHYLFALAATDVGRLSEAIGAYRVCLALKPELADASLRLANALMASGSANDAKPLLQQYVNGHPADHGAKLQLAALQEQVGDLKSAERELRGLLAVPSVRPLAGRRLVAFLERHGKGDEAKRLQLELDPPKKSLRELPKSRR